MCHGRVLTQPIGGTDAAALVFSVKRLSSLFSIAMLIHAGRCLSLPSRRRSPVLLALLIPLVILYYHVFQRYDTRPGSSRSRLSYPNPHLELDQALDGSVAERNLTVNLVIASRRRDDISWTRHLSEALPNLQVIRYISDYLPDEPLPDYHPPVPKKGREATVYHTYMHDFYHDLPDFSIFIHAEEQPWHMDGVLQQSLVFALTHLDLTRIADRGGFTNLRVSWFESCPAWIDTTVAPKDAIHKEEPYVRPAFLANFLDEIVPDQFAGPCCAQFVVTREAIRRNHRSQYLRSRDWLVRTQFGNSIAGRTWEYMWPWLFLHNTPEGFRDHAAKHCPAEWNAYCTMYGICFGDSVTGTDDREAGSRYNERWAEKEALRRDHLEEWWNRLLHPFRAAAAAKRIAKLELELETELLNALERGKDRDLRDRAFLGLFSRER